MEAARYNQCSPAAIVIWILKLLDRTARGGEERGDRRERGEEWQKKLWWSQTSSCDKHYSLVAHRKSLKYTVQHTICLCKSLFLNLDLDTLLQCLFSCLIVCVLSCNVSSHLLRVLIQRPPLHPESPDRHIQYK